MARKASTKAPAKGPAQKPRGLVLVVEKGADRMRGERLRGGDGHKLGGRPHAADSRRDLGRDPMKGDRLRRDAQKD
jgi:hypothetical protein